MIHNAFEVSQLCRPTSIYVR